MRQFIGQTFFADHAKMVKKKMGIRHSQNGDHASTKVSKHTEIGTIAGP